MKIPTVSRFCCVLDLNIGGLMLGYLGMISNGTYAVLLLIDLIFKSEAEQFKPEVIVLEEDDDKFQIPAAYFFEEIVLPTTVNESDVPQGVYWAISVIVVGILFGCFFISMLFIQGISERNLKKLKPFLILTALSTAGALLQGMMAPSFFWILVGMIHAYFLIIVYSLYQLIEFESEQKECHQSAESHGYSQFNYPDLEKDQASEYQGSGS